MIAGQVTSRQWSENQTEVLVPARGRTTDISERDAPSPIHRTRSDSLKGTRGRVTALAVAYGACSFAAPGFLDAVWLWLLRTMLLLLRLGLS